MIFLSFTFCWQISTKFVWLIAQSAKGSKSFIKSLVAENQSGLERCENLYYLGKKNQSVDHQEIWAVLRLHFFPFFYL